MFVSTSTMVIDNEDFSLLFSYCYQQSLSKSPAYWPEISCWLRKVKSQRQLRRKLNKTNSKPHGKVLQNSQRAWMLNYTVQPWLVLALAKIKYELKWAENQYKADLRIFGWIWILAFMRHNSNEWSNTLHTIMMSTTTI